MEKQSKKLIKNASKKPKQKPHGEAACGHPIACLAPEHLVNMPCAVIPVWADNEDDDGGK